MLHHELQLIDLAGLVDTLEMTIVMERAPTRSERVQLVSRRTNVWEEFGERQRLRPISLDAQRRKYSRVIHGTRNPAV